MKPPAFTYHRPASVEEALGILRDVGSDGKVLAGGQSLVPLLNMRLAAPRHLVDINRLAELSGIRCGPDGVRVGALVRHAQLGRHAGAYRTLPLLRQATACVAHPAIRNRGTTVGSIVHADPAAEVAGVLTLVGGTIRLAAAGGTRVVAARDFFVGPLESAIRPDELAVEAMFPLPPPRTATAWLEVSRRRGDFAVCGVGVLVTLDGDGRISGARAAYVSAGPIPVLVDLSDAVLGQAWDSADWAAAGALAAAAVRPDDDIHATSGYRRHLAAVLTVRACRTAAAVAGTQPAGTQPAGLPRTEPRSAGTQPAGLPWTEPRSGGPNRPAPNPPASPTGRTPTGRHATEGPARAGCCRTACATTSATPAPMSAVSTAYAAPARC
jgi:carbon-monoxide dehydrogenase medium subunit